MVSSTGQRPWKSYEPDQIVVEMKHYEIVARMLDDIGLGHEKDPDGIPALSLTLLTVEGLEQTDLSGRLRPPSSTLEADKAGKQRSAEYYEELRDQLQRRRGELRLPGNPSNLDILLEHLRRTARAMYAGWTPTMGKNRDTEAIEGVPHFGGGEGPPEPASDFMIEKRPDTPGRAFRVGILDTRLFPNPQLNGRYVSGDVLKDKEIYRAWEGHASFIAGRILSRAPGADLDVRAVLDENGRASSWNVAKQMASFLGSGVDVINLSLGCTTEDGEEPLLLQRAADVLAGETVLVAAAGNHGDQRALDLNDYVDAAEILATLPRGPNSTWWPAALPNVIAVGATDPTSPDGLASFTPRVPWLDLLAPGVDVPSTFIKGKVKMVITELVDGRLQERAETIGPFHGAALWKGTSFAAADVTGAILALAAQAGRTARQALHMLLHPDDDDARSTHLPIDVRPARGQQHGKIQH